MNKSDKKDAKELYKLQLKLKSKYAEAMLHGDRRLAKILALEIQKIDKKLEELE